MKNIAKEKINNERTNVNGNQYARAVASFVATGLVVFIEENEEFATAVANCDKSFSDCCNQITEGVGQHISDLELYKRAVKFYLPDADIKCEMRVVLPDEGKKFNLSLENFI